MSFTLCTFQFCNYLPGAEKAGCFTFFVILMSDGCNLPLPHGAVQCVQHAVCAAAWKLDPPFGEVDGVIFIGRRFFEKNYEGKRYRKHIKLRSLDRPFRLNHT